MCKLTEKFNKTALQSCFFTVSAKIDFNIVLIYIKILKKDDSVKEVVITVLHFQTTDPFKSWNVHMNHKLS